MNIEIVAQERRASTQELVIMTRQSRHPIVIPEHLAARMDQWEINDYILSEIIYRRRNHLLRDNRHDRFKGFRT